MLAAASRILRWTSEAEQQVDGAINLYDSYNHETGQFHGQPNVQGVIETAKKGMESLKSELATVGNRVGKRRHIYESLEKTKQIILDERDRELEREWEDIRPIDVQRYLRSLEREKNDLEIQLHSCQTHPNNIDNAKRLSAKYWDGFTAIEFLSLVLQERAEIEAQRQREEARAYGFSTVPAGYTRGSSGSRSATSSARRRLRPQSSHLRPASRSQSASREEYNSSSSIVFFGDFDAHAKHHTW